MYLPIGKLSKRRFQRLSNDNGNFVSCLVYEAFDAHVKKLGVAASNLQTGQGT